MAHTCSTCGVVLPSGGTICPNCYSKRPQLGCVGLIVVGLVLFVLVTIGGGLSGSIGHSASSGNTSVKSAIPLPASVQPAVGVASVPAQPVQNQRFFQVKGLGAQDLLNMRAGAGVNFPIVVKVRGDQKRIIFLNEITTNGSTVWYKVQVDGQIGWVNGAFLEPSQN